MEVPLLFYYRILIRVVEYSHQLGGAFSQWQELFFLFWEFSLLPFLPIIHFVLCMFLFERLDFCGNGFL